MVERRKTPERAEHGDLSRKTLIAFAVVTLAAAAGACGSTRPQSAQPVVSSPAPAAAPPASTHVPVTMRPSLRRAAALRVLTEPAAGTGPIYQLITGTRSSKA
jgi:hypothetical protein